MSNPVLKFPDRPNCSVRDLQQDTKALVKQLNDGATMVLVLSVVLASGANKVRHGLKTAPRSCSAIPRSNVAWWQPTQPDGTYVYITTAGALTADLQIWV